MTGKAAAMAPSSPSRTAISPSMARQAGRPVLDGVGLLQAQRRMILGEPRAGRGAAVVGELPRRQGVDVDGHPVLVPRCPPSPALGADAFIGRQALMHRRIPYVQALGHDPGLLLGR